MNQEQCTAILSKMFPDLGDVFDLVDLVLELDENDNFDVIAGAEEAALLAASQYVIEELGLA